jgi:hypothetical protein
MRIGRLIGVSVAVFMMASAMNAQNYRGQAVPVTQRRDPVELSRFRFLTFVFGHEGPMDTPLQTPAVAGREYYVEADVFGIESVATIRFELVDVSGRSLHTITMWKAGDGADKDEFYGFIKVPDQPFRVVASGTSRSGAAFRSVLNRLFQPAANGLDERPLVPPDIPPNQRNRLQGIVDSYSREMQTRSAQTAAEHPDGVITLVRAVVSPIAYEPLNSAFGLPIGIRLHYSIQFPARQTIVAVPLVFPVYQPWAWRGAVEMKPLGGTISPAPQMAGVQSLQEVILYRAAATYAAGTTYTFTVDLVPDYIIQGVQTSRFCIYEQKVTNRDVWSALIASEASVPYSLSISDTETAATIPTFFPQRTFYETFKSSGAADCGPVPNNRF